MVVQVNVKLDEKILKEIEELLKKKYVKTKKEAFEKVLLLLIRHYKASEITEKINIIREGTEELPSVTKAIIESHEEENSE